MIQFKSAAIGAALIALVGGAAFAHEGHDHAAETKLAANQAPASETPASEPAKEAAAAPAMTKAEIAQMKTCKSLAYRTMLRNKMCKAFVAAHPTAIPAPN
ncbi:MAG: hypothetical protein Q8M88_03090 [Phenylobacterium sp.]|uniref:hypothetical protein n=1 Tax=Phenylobacterium sp. TaxID=1871053 RepID=UPI0027365D2B|nr:hypothetical protein [Phenylobacterium sp.]MDP3173403.1 hypothetical protein [Phenylobacterium sp.]